MRRVFRLLVLTAILGSALFSICWYCLPFPEMSLRLQPECRVLVDRHGEVLRIGLPVEEENFCFPISLSEAGPWLPLALISAEDKRFLSHPGVDLAATSRAAFQNTVSMRRVSGASTISTQVIRLAQPRSRTIPTKVIEYFRALQMEQAWDKTEVLEQYLNRTPYGANLVGVRAASLRYFGREPASLCLEEAALLAGLPQAPTRFRPDVNPEAAKVRRDFVLSRMAINGYISEARCRLAIETPIRLRMTRRPFRAPHFCDWVEASTAEGVYRSTIDLGMQDRCERLLGQRAAPWSAHGLDGAALVVIHVPSSSLAAMVGSPDYRRLEGGQVNGAVARRSPGSSLKPFVFARAFDRGWLTPSQMLADVPTSFAGYRPENFDRSWRGLVSAREALADSLNLPALRVAHANGLAPTLDDLRDLGLDTLDQSPETYGMNLVLGGCEVRLLDLANAYACLARGGVYQSLRLSSDEPVESGHAWCSPEAAWMVRDCLTPRDPRAPRFAFKTGTSARHRDTWTVAWDDTWVVGVWMGGLSGRPADEVSTGRDVAYPIARAVMDTLLHDPSATRLAAPPAGLVQRPCCPVSGRAHGPHCPEAVPGWVIDRVSDAAPCSVHREAGKERWPREIAAWLKQDASSALRIVRPRANEHFALFSDSQTIRLEAEASGTVYWYADGRPIGTGIRLGWQPGACEGETVLEARLENGQFKRVQIGIEHPGR